MKIRNMLEKFCLLALASLTGCTARPSVVSAYSEALGDRQLVRVLLNPDDASLIRDRQLYFSIVLVECSSRDNRFPAEPYIQGKRASNFTFSTTGKHVEFNAEIPQAIFKQYRSPCVFLEGGSYFHGKIKTDPVPLVSHMVK